MWPQKHNDINHSVHHNSNSTAASDVRNIINPVFHIMHVKDSYIIRITGLTLPLFTPLLQHNTDGVYNNVMEAPEVTSFISHTMRRVTLRAASGVSLCAWSPFHHFTVTMQIQQCKQNLHSHFVFVAVWQTK